MADVMEALAGRGAEPLILNAAELAVSDFRLDGVSLYVEGLEWPLGSGTRGWLRRFIPEDWRAGSEQGTLQEVERAAWMELLLGVMNVSRIEWLTPIANLDRAENKIVQYRLAAAAGAPVPVWTVTSHVRHLDRHADLVVKPLGPSEYRDDEGVTKLLFVRAVPSDVAWEGWSALSAAPFILQQRIRAKAHYRVVTVCRRSWACVLRGVDELDWRKDSAAHDSFVAADPDSVTRTVEILARKVASNLGVGFSSQDWIWDGEATWFLDLNPAGQWLFLPSPIADAVTEALADWLSRKSSP